MNKEGKIISREDVKKNAAERAAFKEQYLDLKAEGRTKIRATQPIAGNEDRAGAPIQAAEGHLVQERIHVKLPILNLPTFEGQ